MVQLIMRNLLSNKFTFYISILLITAACRKDKPVVIEDAKNAACSEDCIPLPPEPDGFWGGYDFTSDGLTKYQKPFFNPLNSDEFIYLNSEESGSSSLTKYNIVTENQQVLFDEEFITNQPQWGRNGWIVFQTSGRKIWKIRPDGTGLEQITFGVKDLHPSFNFSGDKIIYRRSKTYSNAQLEGNPELFKEYKMMIIDIDGNELDSITICRIDGNMPNSCLSYQQWSYSSFDENEIIYAEMGTTDQYGVYAVNQSDESLVPLHTWNANSGFETFTDLCYFKDYVYYSKYRNGLYKVNTKTGEQTKVIAPCNTRYYESLSVSADGRFLLVGKVVLDQIEGYSIQEKYQIVRIDLQECNQEVILSDE